MNFTEAVIAGTIQPDGTLTLDENPNLSPGRVTVVVRQEFEAKPTSEDWFQFLQRMRTEREASGYPFMNEEETSAYAAWLREPDQVDAMLHSFESPQKNQGQ